jgi:hypothetical protein
MLWPDAYERHVFEEEAMWRTYSTSGGLVRLSWKLGELVEELNRADWSREGKVYMGVVRYLQPKAIREEVKRINASGDKAVLQHAMRVLMMKRFGIAFENGSRAA